MAGLPSGKAEVCKTSMSRFDSDTRLQFIPCNSNELQGISVYGGKWRKGL